MNKTANPPRWYAPWRQGEVRAADRTADPADLGTCFGLELTLAAMSTPGPAAPARRVGWMQRFSSKRPPVV